MDYLSQLKKNIRIGNTADAKNLLARLHDRNEAEKQEAIQAIALSPDKTAFELLSFLTLDGQKDPQINERLIQLVIDRAHLTFKFVLILFENTSSKTLRHIVPLLKHILSSETDRKVLSAVIRAAGKNRLDQMVDDLAEFIFFDDTHLKADAVKALERIGSSGALENLIKASKTDKCDPDILDAIEVLKKEPASRKDRPGKSGILKKTAGSPGLPDLGSPNVRTLLDALKSSPESRLDLPCALADSDITLHHDVLINLLWLVQRTVPLDAVNVLFDLLKKKDLTHTVKFALYNCLAAYPELESGAAFLKGIFESAMHVRLAAIKVLDKNLSDYVCAEIKNKIESGSKSAAVLAQTIIDARAAHLMDYLIKFDAFTFIASNYLSKTSPPLVLDTYISTLEKRGLKSTVKKYTALRKQLWPESGGQIIVISPCQATLDVYSKLIFSSGFSALPFGKTQEAFEQIVSKKPAAVICDLVLPDMTAPDMAKEVRQLYSSQEVPFFANTLLKNLDQKILQEELDKAGINAVLNFPPQTGQIRSWAR